jgi:Trypsin/PEP-CTERM motif
VQFNSNKFRSPMKSILKLCALSAALLTAQAATARAADFLTADIGALTPTTGNTSAPSNWRFAPGQLFNGVAALDGVALLEFNAVDPRTGKLASYACSGSLLAGGAYVLTAGHCADEFVGNMSVSFGFYNGSAAVTRTVSQSGATLHPLWQGFDNSADAGTDLAILKLNTAVTTIQGYKLSTTNDVGKTHLMAGYGTSGSATSNGEPNWNDQAYGHYGYNTFDVTSKAFNQAYGPAVGWGYDASYYTGTTYMSDFDSGTANNNTLARIAALTGNAWTSGAGLGANEALIAGGDSGGGDFVWDAASGQWLLSAVHSWGWQGNENNGTGACDFVGLGNCDNLRTNSSSYGDLSGSTAVFDQTDWINSVVNPAVPVPEPENYALMLVGLGLLGAVARRRA